MNLPGSEEDMEDMEDMDASEAQGGEAMTEECMI